MRARAVIIASAASAGIILLGWQAGTGADQVHVGAAAVVGSPSLPGGSGNTGSAGSSGSSGSSGNADDGGSGAPETAAPSAAPGPTTGSAASGQGVNAAVSGTFKGTSASTRYGAVQVQVTIAAGTIKDVTALQLTDRDQRSAQISNYAAPVLRSQVLAAQSAAVQSISGATATSEGYLTSLQAALDAAHFQTDQSFSLNSRG
ncbi:FMN-binding protein [Paenarthrobacter sp. PH39-S1]|uniref:FMN-binding protein n=1 Tax=Paenarthrobacter sp. PH39-S1 TaxID=3046204 RepID=UPI0024B8C1DD|nr:FMN-binding protein [Paenarthrobacter sp. PH39-S1]MDJ0357169.1 FMN-binding protein [Paenarthrobacter sp. PH39-S1]